MPKKVAPAQVIWELQNQLEDFDLYAKDVIINLHWTTEQFDETDYYRLMQVFNAKEKKDRQLDPLDLMKQVQKG